MSNQPIESRTSNALGVRIPQWIIRQLNKRSEQLSVEKQNTTTPNENVLFRGNRSAWVRMVSSVDIIDPFTIFFDPTKGDFEYVNLGENKAKRYFQDLGIDIKNASDLAKKFVLQGGTAIYKNENDNFSYNLRGGFPDTYNVAGNEEVKNYGYRPMPGITSVRVQTQGKLGSIRAAEIQLKVWDKAQLDIIDALYFKLGYTMFLEWGHTNYYKENGEFGSTESYSLDPFEAGLTKEDIYNKVSNSIRESEGNYDAMLGMVTNFNFTYNQEGGYDCTIKLISLGVLISNMKMNNPRVLPELQESVIKRLVNTLTELEKQRIAKERAAAEAEARTNPTLDSSYPPCVRKYGEPTQATDGGPYGVRPPKGDPYEGYTFYNNGRAADPTGKTVNYSCQDTAILINGKKIAIQGKDFKAKYLSQDPQTKEFKGGKVSFASNTTKTYENADFTSIAPAYGPIFYINKLNGFIPTEYSYLDKYKILLDGSKIADRFKKIKSEDKSWKDSTSIVELAVGDVLQVSNFVASAIDYLAGTNINPDTTDVTKKVASIKAVYSLYSRENGITYNMSIDRYLYGISENENAVNRRELVTYAEFSQAFIKTITSENAKYNLIRESFYDVPENKIKFIFKFTVPVPKKVLINTGESKDPLGNIVPSKKEYQNVNYQVTTILTIEDSELIKGVEIYDSSIQQPSDFIGKIQDLQDANKPLDSQASQQNQVEPPSLNASDIQKTEAEKYKSAFEVIIRTIQLYSLDNAIASKIGEDRVVKKLSLIDDKRVIYNEFTKKLFSVGLFSNILDELISVSSDPAKLKVDCENYDKEMQSGTISDKERMLFVRALFGFHFGLLGNTATAQKLLEGDLVVNFKEMMSSYTVPYEFNQGIVQGTQLNHPVYIPLGFVIMILNHMCTIYDNNKPVIYLDFNHKSNICLSNAKHLSTNPYDILIPFQGTNEDFLSILEPTTLQYGKNQGESDSAKRWTIMPMSGSDVRTKVYTPRNDDASKEAIKDRISGGLLKFKPEQENEIYRGRTMHVLISCDYLLRSVGTFTKSNGSGDVYVREFIEQILSDINKSLGDINVFRLAYDDSGNAIHIVDDQMTQNLEERYPVANESFRDIENKSKLPLFGKGSIAKTLEIRTEVSSKLSNMIAVSANANMNDQANLSKSTDSFGFYNSAYKDRYIPNRTEYASEITLPTDTMIRSTVQFNEAIKTFYGDAKPAEGSVGHATNYYIQRMSKIKSSEKGTRASAMIPVSLNFSMDGMSGFGMGQSFTIDPEFLPYTYNLSLTDPYGEQDRNRTVAFVMTGLDHTIEGNQWTSNVRTNMIYAKDHPDFKAPKIEKVNDATGLIVTNLDNKSYNLGKVDLGPLNTAQPWENIAFDFISSQEGFLERPKPDEGTLRAGYGTDIFIGADGVKKSVGSDTFFTREDAKRTLIWEIQNDYSKRVIRQIGQQTFNALTDTQKASLTSFAYNCGSLTKSVRAAINSNSGNTAVANAIAAGPTTGAESGKVYTALVKRRKLEATLYLS